MVHRTPQPPPQPPSRLIVPAVLLVILVVLLLLLGVTTGHTQSLSNQVLQLLTRDNIWTGEQRFQDLRVPDLTPADTDGRIYNSGGNLYWDGVLIGDVGAPVSAPHTLLSATHSDTAIAAVARGALIVGNSTPAWSRLTVGTVGQVLRSDGTDVAWSTDGSALTALNASNLASGTVPVARLSGITNTQVDAAAAIAWTKISKTGSSLADLTTRSAADLTSGTLDDARLSANVSLLGSSISSAEIVDGTIANADIGTGVIGLDKLNGAYTGCSLGEALVIVAGPAVDCALIGVPGVTSVALSAPAIFSVSGSPITSTGTLTLGLATQTANTVWAGPSSGGAVAPTFRALVNGDLPTSGVVAGTYPKVTVNDRGVVTTGTSQITLTTDVTGVLPLANGGTGLSAASDDVVMVSTGSAWAGLALPNTGSTGALQYTTATNTFSALANVTTQDNTQTLTNKSYDTRATGNSFTDWHPQIFQVGSCTGGTATTPFYGDDNGTTTKAGAACSTLLDRALAVYNFDAAASEGVVITFAWPSSWDGATIDVRLRWFSATGAVVGRVIWEASLACVQSGAALPTGFGGTVTAEGNPSTTAGAPVNTVVTPTVGGLGCQSNWPAMLRLRRLGADASDTMAGDASLIETVIEAVVVR